MDYLSSAHLSEDTLRGLAGNTVYLRGNLYYRQNRVELITNGNNAAHLHVFGSQSYCVDIWLENGNAQYGCTCPYAMGHYFCKHMVAAGLYLRDYFRSNDPQLWRNKLTQAFMALKSPSRTASGRPSYLLFFSLQQYFATVWQIQPHSLPITALPEGLWEHQSAPSTGILAEFVEHNPWVAEKSRVPKQALSLNGCLNCSPETVAVANLLIRNETSNPVGYYYYSTNRSLVDYLDLLAVQGAPLFYGTPRTPLSQALQVLPEDGEVQIKMTRTEDGVRLNTSLEPGFACGIANVQIEGVDPVALNGWLWDKHRIIAVAIKHAEFEGSRISPSVYTRPEELDRFIDAMAHVARRGLPA